MNRSNKRRPNDHIRQKSDTLTIIGTLGSLMIAFSTWMTIQQNRLDDRHREDIKEIREDQKIFREDLKKMDEKWERLFEKFFEKDRK